jgi:chlorobactene glucosyltransferase
MLLFVAIFWSAVVTGLLWRAITQYRHYETLSPAASGGKVGATVAVIIPARNEEHTIARCLKSLVAQEYPSCQIIVVNDNSTDATAARVREFQTVRLIEGQPLPPGWAGKPHACWQGASATTAEWLCFMDADTVANPGLLASAVEAAERRGLDMLSLEPYQELGSFWERLIIPAGFFLLAFQQDLRRVNNPDAADAVANGQFILVRRSAYVAVGGHAAVRAEICEDSALALAVKRSGRKLALIGAEKLIRTRMYTGLFSLWQGLSKNVTEMLGGPGVTAMVAMAALFLGVASLALPAWAWPHIWHGGIVERVSAVAIWLPSLALLGTHIAGAIYFGIPFWYGFLFPFGYIFGAAIALNSVRWRRRGRVSWKGRIYEPPAKPQIS